MRSWLETKPPIKGGAPPVGSAQDGFDKGWGVLSNQGMAMTQDQLTQHINTSGFISDPTLREQVTENIWNGLRLFRECSKRSYYSHTGKVVKKPGPSHSTTMGRFDQEDARIILISAICRAWILGTGHEPTLNNKRDYDSAFMNFASYILACEGIGHIHAHLEKYWSQRKQDWAENAEILKRAIFRGE